jgi:hypothetical protein
MTDEELGREIYTLAKKKTPINVRVSPTDKAIGEAARALLAKPVATREVTDEEVAIVMREAIMDMEASDKTLGHVLAALHAAGMKVIRQ